MDNIPVAHRLTTLSGFSPTGSTGSQQQGFQHQDGKNIYAQVCILWVRFPEHKWIRFGERRGFFKGNKNDYNDAEGICEAVRRPTMRFVPLKTLEQQDIQALHRIRHSFVKTRTALVNQTRGLLWNQYSPGYVRMVASNLKHL